MSCNDNGLPVIYQGNSAAYTVEVVNEDGTPVDITGKSIVMTIADDPQATPLIQKTNTIHDDPLNGTTIFLLTHAEVALSMPAGSIYSIDFTMIDGAELTTLYVGSQAVVVPVRNNS